MHRRQHLVRVIQSLAAQEAQRQPTADDWLWAQDKAGREVMDPNDEAQMRSWAAILGVSPDKLAGAILEVGTSADAIRQCLARPDPPPR